MSISGGSNGAKRKGVYEDLQTWGNVKNVIKGRNLAIRMNDFFTLHQQNLTMEEFYSKFVTLHSRYAPSLTNAQQVERFCESLNKPLETTLEMMKLVYIQDALE